MGWVNVRSEMPSRGIKLNRTPELGSAPRMTPTVNPLPLRRADFASLADALDYAAQGRRARTSTPAAASLPPCFPIGRCATQAQQLARRLLSLRLERGARVAVIAETNPDFLRFFFACQYAGLVPVALPASANLGGHAAYVARLRGLLVGCGASVAMASTQFLRFLREAAEGMDLAFIGHARRLRRTAGARRRTRSRAARPKPPTCNTRRAARAFRAAS